MLSTANPYSPARRILMQLATWIVLAASVGVAALVNRQRDRAFLPKLDHPSVVSGLTVCLPENWRVETGDIRSPSVLLICREGDGTTGGRLITIERHGVFGMPSPQEILARARQAHSFEDSPAGSMQGAMYEAVTFGDIPGLLVSGRIGDPAMRLTIASSVFPNRQAVTIRLQSWGQNADIDSILVKEIANTVKLDGVAAWPSPGGILELSDAPSLQVPEKFALLPEPDPLRLSRTIVLAGLPDRWMSVEFSPLYWLSPTTEFDVRTLMILRNPRWRDALFENLDDYTWRATLTGGDTSSFPHRAYLRGSKGGAGLIATFQASGSDLREIDATWSALSSSLKFPAESALAARMTAGAAEATRLGEVGLATLVGPEREETWWHWYAPDFNQNLAWTRLRFQHSSLWMASRETRCRLGGEDYLRIAQQWKGSPDLRSYQSLTAHTWRVASAADRRDQKQATNVEQGKIQIDLFGLTASKTSAAAASTPTQFVPGGWLPFIIGKTREIPMILMTDSLVLDDTPPLPTPIMLVMDPETRFPRTADNEETPMRCISISVNGSSERSLHYFRENGELEMIIQSGGIQCTRVDPQSIRLNFSSEPGMLPSIDD